MSKKTTVVQRNGLGNGVASSNGARRTGSLRLKFTNSSKSLLPDDYTPSLSSTKKLLASQSEAALRLLQIRLKGMSSRLALSFLLLLALLLAWTIAYFNVTPLFLVLLGVASLAVGNSRWQQVVEGAELEAELRVRQKQRRQVQGESAEWINIGLQNWWKTCNESILMFIKTHVEPLIQDILPLGIDKLEVVEVDLGGQTPSISNMKLLDVPSSSATTATMVATFDLTVPSPDSRIVLRAQLGGKSFGCNYVAHVDSLYVSGTLQALVVIDNQIPFPHVAKLTATFIKKPDIWFSVKILKGLKVSAIPVLKTCIHSIVMEIFTTLLVDPGKLTLHFDPSVLNAGEDGYHGNVSRKAKGVVTVKITGQNHTHEKAGGGRVLSCRLGNKKYHFQVPVEEEWVTTYSFLVYSIQDDMLVIKVKMRRWLYGNAELAAHSIPLDSLGLRSSKGEESSEDRTVRVDNSECRLSLAINYTPLPSFSTKLHNAFPSISSTHKCGVLYVHVHGGQDLPAADSNGLSDPYCIVTANKRKILRTRYVPTSLRPSWEEGVEVLVSDISQVVLRFVVLDWDGPISSDDLLGTAQLQLNTDSPELLGHTLALGQGVGVDKKTTPSKGTITVSVVFRPVASVGQASPDCHVTSDTTTRHPQVEEVEVGVVSKKNHIKKKRRKKLPQAVMEEDEEEEDHMTNSVMELQLIKGRDLVPKDSNGLSDPYVIVKYGSKITFRSKVIKKTLNPEWNQTATLTPPNDDDIIYVECWDKDVFSDDFMGSIYFTASTLLDTFSDGASSWCKLDHVKHGQLLLCMTLVGGGEGGRSHRGSEERQWPDHHDNPSKFLVGEVELRDGVVRGGTIELKKPHPLTGEGEESYESSSSLQSSSIQESLSDICLPGRSAFTPGHTRTCSADLKQTNLKRRHTLPHGFPHSFSSELFQDTTKNTSDLPRYTETTADIQRALKKGGVASNGGVASMSKPIHREKQIKVYHDVSGQVVEATGLKGDVGHLELYVKVRLNTRPSYQRQHKFGRGPVVHKTRTLKGSHNLQWNENFVVKESPVPSDALLTFDLKSGSKINIGTYVITLDKFLEGQHKVTRYLDIGNDAKLKVKLSRQV